MTSVTIIGAGLAGCEACWQLISRNIPVTLIEMRPTQTTPAHKSAYFAELVCSNSLRSNEITNAVGLLKAEMRQLDSLILKVADQHAIPAGSALAVDREGFAKEITEILSNHPLVTIQQQEVTEIPEGPCIIATGPLTSDALSKEIAKLLAEDSFYFYDAAAPILEKESIDMNVAYMKSRYDKEEASYINCPMNKEQFEHFYHELIHAQVAQLHLDEEEKYFEGCMPVEEMARRGEKTLLFGPLKPVGLETENNKPYAVVQLRQDNAAASLYNMVGFQTHLTWKEQKRVFSLIPGLEKATFARYGVMHRNSYICSPRVLKPTYECKKKEQLFFAGQMCGVEGYVESSGSGLVAGINMALQISGKEAIVFPPTCMLGALSHYITHTHPNYFQPMNAAFGIMRVIVKTNKNNKKEKMVEQALNEIDKIKTLL